VDARCAVNDGLQKLNIVAAATQNVLESTAARISGLWRQGL
jgi:hypothetical protein